MGKFRFIATAAFDDHCSTSSYHGVHYFRYLPKCNENGTFILIKFLQNVGKVEILGAEVKMEKTSKIIGDLEAIANERVGADPRKGPFHWLNDPLGVSICTLQGCQAWFLQASKAW